MIPKYEEKIVHLEFKLPFTIQNGRGDTILRIDHGDNGKFYWSCEMLRGMGGYGDGYDLRQILTDLIFRIFSEYQDKKFIADKHQTLMHALHACLPR